MIDHASKWTAARIRRLRVTYNESQSEFATRLRVGAAALQTWEQERGRPSDTACLVLDILEAVSDRTTPPLEIAPPRRGTPPVRPGPKTKSEANHAKKSHRRHPSAASA